MKGVYILNYYVYLHRKKTTGEVFYVCKGCEMRAWISSGRNEFWKRVVDKHGLVVEIYMDNLQEWYAYELEEDYGVSLKNLFSIKKTKYAKGWEWVKDDCSKNN